MDDTHTDIFCTEMIQFSDSNTFIKKQILHQKFTDILM
jgi:hypothetical protein